MDIKEKRVRLQAKLRNWQFEELRKAPLSDHYLLLHDEGAIHEAADPTTPDGAWEWVALLGTIFYVEITGPYDAAGPKDSWTCGLHRKNDPEQDEHPEVLVRANTAPAAIAAAIDALAKQEFPDEPALSAHS